VTPLNGVVSEQEPRSKGLQHLVRLLVQLQFGESQYVEAAAHQLQVSGVIILERHFASVIAVTVGFDHEPLPSPEEVDQVRTDANIDLWRRQPATATQPQEVCLQITAGSNPGVPLIDRQPQHVRLPYRPAQFATRNRSVTAG